MTKNLSIIFSLYYFVLATISGIFMTILPIYYLELGFSEIEISFLSSILFLATFIQLVLNRFLKDMRKWFLFSALLIIISILLLRVSDTFLIIAVILFFSTGFRILIVSLIDDYTMTTKLDIGKTRKFATIGFGCSGIIYLFLATIFSPFFMILSFTIILFIISFFLPKYERPNTPRSFKNIKSKDLIIFNAIFMSIVGLKLTYQSIYFGDALLVAAFMGVTVIIESVILNYSTRIKVRSRILVSISLFSISVILIVMSSAIVVVCIAAIIQGIALGIYVPSYFIHLQKHSENLTSSIIYSSTMQCIVGFLIAFFIVLPLYNIFPIEVLMLSFVGLLFISYGGYKLYQIKMN